VDKWLKVSLTVNGELAEAVAEVLSRYAPGGVVIEATRVVANDVDEGQAVGPWHVYGFLHADRRLEETRQQLEQALWYLGRISPLPEARFETVEEADWAEAWKAHYHPIPIGKRLYIVPSWQDSSLEGRISVRMDPGMAFGTGTHPSTQLCLELLEEVILANDGLGAMIDVGTGSGILAIAALKLGVGQALGVDTDPLAVRVARENALANDLADRLEVGEGSVEEVLAEKFALRQAPLAVVNILAPVIVRLLDDGLGELVAPGGALILAGILAEQEGEVLAAARSHGFELTQRRQEGDWVGVSLMHLDN
jgi:ribosomal protein L11 methyltransferase